jgi:hypothetical protein
MVNPSIDQVNDRGAGPFPAVPDLAELIGLALAGLVPMFNEEKQLFCYRLHSTNAGLVQEGLSPRYTMMTLLGLHRAEETGVGSPVNIRQIFDGMLRDTVWADNIGDLGLLLWTCATIRPDRLRETWRKLNFAKALDGFRDVGEGRTMELAWFLTGLAHTAPVEPACAGLEASARRTYRLLKENRGPHGFFGHMARRKSVAGLLRGHYGSFADQVYPICALAAYSKAFDPAAAAEARQSAEALCRLQGPLGQWWWHYDARRGTVFEEYPVYSVHQHAMGPMALFALDDIGTSDFVPFIYRGLQWVTGENELGYDMRDHSAQLIWRSFYYANAHNRYFARLCGFADWAKRGESTKDLQVMFESRPYELGWLLYAFAGRPQSSGAAERGY